MALREKLVAFGRTGAGKPLVKDLKGFHRVTVGRVRCIARRDAMGNVIVVYVLEVGLRKAAADDDAYELARKALAKGDIDVYEAMEEIARAFLAGRLENDPND